MDPLWDDTLGGPTPSRDARKRNQEQGVESDAKLRRGNSCALVRQGSGLVWGSALSSPGSIASSPFEESPLSALRRRSTDFTRPPRPPPLTISTSLIDESTIPIQDFVSPSKQGPLLSPSSFSPAFPQSHSLPPALSAPVQRTASLPSAFSGGAVSPSIFIPVLGVVVPGSGGSGGQPGQLGQLGGFGQPGQSWERKNKLHPRQLWEDEKNTTQAGQAWDSGQAGQSGQLGQPWSVKESGGDSYAGSMWQSMFSPSKRVSEKKEPSVYDWYNPLCPPNT